MHLTENSILSRYDWAAAKIREITGSAFPEGPVSLFDIGSGDGVLRQHIKFPAVNYHAFDLEPLAIDTRAWDIETPFPYDDAPSQIITMLEVVEHLKNPWLCMQNIAHTIKPGGYLILTTPNPAWSTSRIELLKSGYLSCFSQSDLELNHHVFTPWPHIINRLLTDTGFRVTEYSTLDGKTTVFDGQLTGLSMPVKLAARITKKFIELNDKTACGMSYGIVAKQND